MNKEELRQVCIQLSDHIPKELNGDQEDQRFAFALIVYDSTHREKPDTMPFSVVTNCGDNDSMLELLYAFLRGFEKTGKMQ